ncbi:DoxX family protein [Nonomuraea pusilla]|uniref:Putative oxidoreductase n=1 Tax=Nonomuraea pusilla TaxID=46177 RepID=A0A1H7YZC8_9ACTN|nr:DoxX family protein [Nonomuraea pusilla]SEM51345.1 putative oxidoreductase [Nonomuraea pusilla]
MRRALHDLAALVARLGVGGIVFANGWTKLEDGLKDTGARFQAQGAPAPGAWATVTMLSELVGGALLVAGLAVSVTGLVLFAEALGVFLVAPPVNPISLNELILLGVASVLLAVVGAGRLSADHLVVIRRRESEAAGEFAADAEADRVIAALRDPDAPPASRAAGPPLDTARKDAADTAPHPRPLLPGEDPREEDGEKDGEDAGGDRGGPREAVAESAPAPGDTLVAGRRKPATRRRPPSGS